MLVTGLPSQAVEGSTLSLNLSPPSGDKAFPYPTEFQWSKDGIPISNTSVLSLGYPGVVFRNVSRADAGQYSLSATNYKLETSGEVIGEGTGTFQLEVLCELHTHHACSTHGNH